jgi:Golgi apparatus protein 1
MSYPCLLRFLQDFRDEINEDACQAQVRKYQELAAQDIRFNPRLADACVQDRMDLCAHVPLVSAACCICSVPVRGSCLI